MAKGKQPVNPFYVLLVVVGVVFFVTACAYGMMAFRAIQPGGEAAGSDSGLLAFLNRYGMPLLLGEVALLAVVCFAAMATDQYWTRRANASKPAADGPNGSPGDELAPKNR